MRVQHCAVRVIVRQPWLLADPDALSVAVTRLVTDVLAVRLSDRLERIGQTGALGRVDLRVALPAAIVLDLAEGAATGPEGRRLGSFAAEVAVHDAASTAVRTAIEQVRVDQTGRPTAAGPPGAAGLGRGPGVGRAPGAPGRTPGPAGAGATPTARPSASDAWVTAAGSRLAERLLAAIEGTLLRIARLGRLQHLLRRGDPTLVAEWVRVLGSAAGRQAPGPAVAGRARSGSGEGGPAAGTPGDAGSGRPATSAEVEWTTGAVLDALARTASLEALSVEAAVSVAARLGLPPSDPRGWDAIDRRLVAQPAEPPEVGAGQGADPPGSGARAATAAASPPPAPSPRGSGPPGSGPSGSGSSGSGSPGSGSPGSGLPGVSLSEPGPTEFAGLASPGPASHGSASPGPELPGPEPAEPEPAGRALSEPEPSGRAHSAPEPAAPRSGPSASGPPGSAPLEVMAPTSAPPGLIAPGLAFADPRGGRTPAWRELEVASVLPFLLVGPLDDLGVLDAVAAALAGPGWPELLAAFAGGLARKALPPPADGWLQPPAVTATVAAFSGQDQPPAGAHTERLGQTVERWWPVVEEVLMARLTDLRTPGSALVVAGSPGGLVAADADGLAPMVWDADPAAVRRLWDRCGRPPVLTDAGASDPLVELRAGDGDGLAEPLADLVALAGERPAGGRADLAPELDGPLGLLAGVALAALAWQLWDRHGERTHPALALRRLGDLDGRVRLERDRVGVTMPLGRRHADLRDSGLLRSVEDVPWLHGRRLELEGG